MQIGLPQYASKIRDFQRRAMGDFLVCEKVAGVLKKKKQKAAMLTKNNARLLQQVRALAGEKHFAKRIALNRGGMYLFDVFSEDKRERCPVVRGYVNEIVTHGIFK